jgi:hypothetical protein
MSLTRHGESCICGSTTWRETRLAGGAVLFGFTLLVSSLRKQA